MRSRELTATDLFGPNVETVTEGDEEFYYVRMCLGGKDEEGLYQVVLDGPAEGERVYVND